MQNHRQGLNQKSTLTENELAAIKNLADFCNQHEQLRMRIDWSMLKARSGPENNDFLYYVDDALVGYLSMDGSGSEKREVVAMVHPEHRRKGIFRILLQAAVEECMQWGVKKLLFICERHSSAGKVSMTQIGARHRFSEHEMVLQDFKDHYTFDERLAFRKAGAEDLEMLTLIKAASFANEEESARARIKRFLQDPKCHYYLATFGEARVCCQEPVGLLRLEDMDDAIGIYSFGVIPAYRGRGYGRQMLEEVIRSIRAQSQKPIMLDVEVGNTNAIGLYRSCGFQIKTTYDYYELPI